MDVNVERLLQIIGEEVVKNRLLEEQLATAEAFIRESQSAPVTEGDNATTDN